MIFAVWGENLLALGCPHNLPIVSSISASLKEIVFEKKTKSREGGEGGWQKIIRLPT